MSKEETLSISTKEIPKHKNALEEKYKEKPKEEKEIFQKQKNINFLNQRVGEF